MNSKCEILEIYRPYVSVVKTGKCMSKSDVSLMKLNSYLILRTVYQKMGWLDKDVSFEKYDKDSFVQYYYNDGEPYVDFLLNYYHTMYFCWLNNCGDKVDFAKNYEIIYENNKDKCSNEKSWNKDMAKTHKLILLYKDRFWYKRFFRECYDKYIEEIYFFKNGKPRILENSEILNLKEENIL